MNQYIKFIVRVLLTCFFYCLFRRYNTSSMWPRTVSMGMVLGIFIMVLYLLSLALHGQSIVSGILTKPFVKARRQMIWRLMLVGSLVVLGLKIPGIEAISMFVGVALIQPALYVVYWWLSRHF